MADTENPNPEEVASPSEEIPESPTPEPLQAPISEPRARPLWPGVLAWSALCAVYIALDYTDLLNGVWFAVPFIAPLVLARALEGWPKTRRVIGSLSGLAALGCVAGGLALWLWRNRLIDPPDSELTWYAATASGFLIALGLLLLPCVIRSARARLFPWLGLDPNSAVHTTAVVLFVVTLVGSGGLFALLKDAPSETILLYLTDPLVSLLSDVPLALVGVGFLLTRNLPATLARLDFRLISPRQLALTFPTAALFLVAVGVLDYAEELLLPEIHVLEERFSMKFVGVSPLLGAPLVSLAAGVGEEAVFRGALQPRLGLLLTALLFAGLHVQYQLPGMVMVFLIGLGLGLLKERTSTTFTACIHVLYDIGAFLLPG